MMQSLFKIRTVAGLIVGLLMVVGQAWSANTVVETAHTTDVSAMDSDWTMNGERNIDYILFQPGAADDILVIKENTDAGPRRVYIKASDAYTKSIPMGGVRIKLMIDYSACTLTAGHIIIVAYSKN